jgi:hypothetical protein
VIQRLARIHLTPRTRESVARMVSPEIGLPVSPSSKATCAAICKVQRLESVPNSLGRAVPATPARPPPALDPRRPCEHSVRMLRSRPEGLRQSLLVEGVDGVARGLRIAAQLVGDLVGVLAPVAGDEDLAERRKVKALPASASLPPGTHARRRSVDARRLVVSCYGG